MLVITAVTEANETAEVLSFPNGKRVLVDCDVWERIKRHKWFVKRSGSCWYCCRKVPTEFSCFFVRMHRQIMHTIPGYVVHHINGDSLDNRVVNMMNVTKDQHNFFH